MNKAAVKKPTAGINKAPVPSTEEAAKPSANELLSRFLMENNITLLIDTLDRNIRTVDDGSIIVGKPRIVAEYKNE